MSETKHCPLKFRNQIEEPCTKSECAWWTESGCAVKSLSESISKIEDKLK